MNSKVFFKAGELMRRIFHIFLITTICGTFICISSCVKGENKDGNIDEDENSVTLDIRNEIGDLNNFITLNSDKATISLSEKETGGEVVVKLSSTIPVTVIKNVSTNYAFDIMAHILDKNLNEISYFTSYDIEGKYDYDNIDLDVRLTRGPYRAIASRSFPKEKWTSSDDGLKTWEQIKKNGKYIVLTTSEYSKYEEY